MPNFLDPPGRRLAFDADGSVVTAYNVTSGAITELTTGNKQVLNNESTDSYDGIVAPSAWHLGFYLPGARDIADLFLAGAAGGSGVFQGIDWSADSTNPLDGTWTTIAYAQNAGSSVVPNYRTSPSGFVASGAKAIRIRISGGLGANPYRFHAFHIYGTRAAGDVSRQCALVTSGGVRLGKDFDFQDQPRGSTYKWKTGTLFNQVSELYVKNFGATTANNVVVGQDALTGTMHNNIRISLDDITYTQTLTATTIAAGASYGPIFVRWTPPSNDTLGLQTMRTKVTVGSWS